jgi:hypothetical protein
LLVVPGFFYRSFTRELTNRQEKLTPDGASLWRIRFCPVEAGQYSAVIRLRDRTGSAEKKGINFTARRETSPGFVRISPRDRRYFEFDDGRSYFPVGANVCWAGSRGTFDYEAWFPAYAKVGCNYARLWLSPHWTTFALERTGRAAEGLGMGQFDLANAWRIDRVLELAESNGLYLMLCIDSFNILRAQGAYPEWDRSPHNAVNGGPLKRPGDFWTDPTMGRLYRDKLRYLVARYGAYTHLFSWEFWNEVDIITDYQTDPVRNWHTQMAQVLRNLDPYKHLITTSFARTPGDSAIDKLPELDYVQTHNYNSPDIALTLAREQQRKTAYGKPHYVGEVGADSGGPRAETDPDGLQVHDPLWVTIATGGSGAAQSWWWDNYIHPRNLYHLYMPVTRFIADIDWPAEGMQPITPQIEWPVSTVPQPGAPPLVAWGIAGKSTVVVWIRLEGRTWKRVCALKENIPSAGASVLVLPGLPVGQCQAEVWDTWSGTILEKQKISIPSSGQARVNLPPIERDLAVKLRRWQP